MYQYNPFFSVTFIQNIFHSDKYLMVILKMYAELHVELHVRAHYCCPILIEEHVKFQ
jgi:hypothetical protein